MAQRHRDNTWRRDIEATHGAETLRQHMAQRHRGNTLRRDPRGREAVTPGEIWRRQPRVRHAGGVSSIAYAPHVVAVNKLVSFSVCVLVTNSPDEDRDGRTKKHRE